MFEEIVSNAVKMLILVLWGTIVFIIVGGALWMHSYKKTR
jgi:hypothetical protein